MQWQDIENHQFETEMYIETNHAFALLVGNRQFLMLLNCMCKRNSITVDGHFYPH